MPDRVTWLSNSTWKKIKANYKRTSNRLIESPNGRTHLGRLDPPRRGGFHSSQRVRRVRDRSPHRPRSPRTSISPNGERPNPVVRGSLSESGLEYILRWHSEEERRRMVLEVLWTVRCFVWVSAKDDSVKPNPNKIGLVPTRTSQAWKDETE